MFNNLFYYIKMYFVETCIDFFLYMMSIIVLRKKIGIGKNPYRQVRLPKNQKSESAKKIAIGASLIFIDPCVVEDISGVMRKLLVVKLLIYTN